MTFMKTFEKKQSFEKQACFAGSVQTLPDATPPTGKNPHIQKNCCILYTKDAIVMSLNCLNVLMMYNKVYFMTVSTI